MKSFGCMPAVRTPEASRTLTMPHPGILPSPLRDKVGVFDHDRFRGYVSVHFRSGLHPPCLRFAVAVAGHHARLGTRLLVRLCRGRHLRRLNFMRLQGATPTPPWHTGPYHGGSTGLSFCGNVESGEGRDRRKHGCAGLFAPPGVMTCAKTPWVNRPRPPRGTSARHGGVVP